MVGQGFPKEGEGSNSPRLREDICSGCVYASEQIDPEEFASEGACGLGCTPGDELCVEMRTRDCSLRRKPVAPLGPGRCSGP